MEQAKRQALTRRSNKLIEWLRRSEYNYRNEKSTDKLIRVIDLIIWALERSIPAYNWRHFKVKFAEAMNMAAQPTEDKDELKANYNAAKEATISTLSEYTEYIATHDFAPLAYDE
jgi:hypothetical protein